MRLTKHFSAASFRAPWILLIGAGFLASLRPPSAISGDRSLNLAEAVARAYAGHPSLKVIDAERVAAEARVITSLMIPNPSLEVEVEDALGGGIYRGFDSAIYNVGISQLIQLGGKRKLQGLAAERERDVQALRYEATKRELLGATAVRFVGVLAAQSVFANARRNLEIAEEAEETVKRLQEGGRGSKIEVVQSRIGTKEASLARQQAERDLQVARQLLAAMWSAAEPDFDEVEGGFAGPVSALPELESLESHLADHPAMLAARTDIDAAQRRLDVEKRNRIPNLDVGVSWRRDSVVDDNSLLLGFSLPLPIRNRNEGGIAEGKAGIVRAEALVAQTENDLRMALAGAWTRLATAQATYELVEEEMVPAALEQQNTVTEAFELGRKTYLELLEARRALWAARLEGIRALQSYHSARVEIEALTGRSL